MRRGRSGFTATFKINKNYLSDLINEFRSMGPKLLSFTSYRVRKIFLQELVAGQTLNYTHRGAGKTCYGRYKRSWKVFRVTSVPANLFERGRRLNDGSKEKGKYLLTRELPNLTRNHLDGIIRDFTNYISKDKL